MSAHNSSLSAFIIDPARVQELVDPEFIADGPFFSVVNDRAQLGGRYDSLPASVADDPTAFGAFLGNGKTGATALVAICWDGGDVRFHCLKSPVVVRTNTVADAGGEAIVPGGGAAALGSAEA